MTGALEGRVALITGAESGIGQAIAIEFAKAGADIVVHYYSDEDGSRATSKEVENCGRRAITVQADQRVEAEVEHIFDRALEAFPRVDILVNEVAPLGINVVAIGPGMILTPINQEAIDDPEVRERQVTDIPMQRAGEPWEVGRLATYLASADADYVTGTTVYIDGGLMINARQGA